MKNLWEKYPLFVKISIWAIFSHIVKIQNSLWVERAHSCLKKVIFLRCFSYFGIETEGCIQPHKQVKIKLN